MPFSPFRFTNDCEKTIENWGGILSQPDPENLKRGGIQIYENKFIDKQLASASPMFPIIWTLPIIVYGLYDGFANQEMIFKTLALFVFGIVIWTLSEYLLHRFMFHLDARENDTRSVQDKANVFLLHGYHHEFPNHKTRLVVPPIGVIVLGLPIAFLIYLLMGSTNWLQFLSGFFLGYLAYDWIHYYTHHFVPKNPVGKFLRDYHLIHHYRHKDANFGISNPFWDIVFGTYQFSRGESKASRMEA